MLYSHGGNDAQKTMGVIVTLLVSAKASFASEPGWLHYFYVADNKTIPHWVELGAYSAISLGTLFGGWRIVRTMGTRITKLRPVGGFCAETGGAAAIMIATHFGIPVSTTHTITGAIMGVGATQRLSAVRWGIARRIVWAWVITIPAAALIAAVSYRILAAAIRALKRGRSPMAAGRLDRAFCGLADHHLVGERVGPGERGHVTMFAKHAPHDRLAERGTLIRVRAALEKKLREVSVLWLAPCQASRTGEEFIQKIGYETTALKSALCPPNPRSSTPARALGSAP